MTTVTSVPVRSLIVDRVGTAERVHVQGLDVVGVHVDLAEVAGELEATGVGRRGEDLGPGRAVEEQRVLVAVALDDVAAVAGVPGEGVVA